MTPTKFLLPALLRPATTWALILFGSLILGLSLVMWVHTGRTVHDEAMRNNVARDQAMDRVVQANRARIDELEERLRDLYPSRAHDVMRGYGRGWDTETIRGSDEQAAFEARFEANMLSSSRARAKLDDEGR